MEATKDMGWYQYPTITIPSPVLALAAERDGVWAGGIGGVAWYPIHSDWQDRITGLPLTSVAALIHVHGLLIAGGTEGIAYSHDGGLTWQKANAQDEAASISALMASPNFERDHTALAATLENGILRSEDGGKNWSLVTFGLQCFDITSLVWGPGESVLAGTAEGIYSSPNGGRAWRLTKGSEGAAVAAIAFLPDGTVVATLEDGGMLRSQNGGLRWSVLEEAREDVQGTALIVTNDGTLLLGTAGSGILRSPDGGKSWDAVHEDTVLSFALHDKTLYAGLTGGLCVSVNDGITWISLPHPPIHDLRKLLIFDGQPLLVGLQAGILRYGSKNTWAALPETPSPILDLEQAPDGSLIVSSLDGLARSTDGGWTWEEVLQDDAGQVTLITFRPDGSGWAGSSDGQRLLRTLDLGKSWQPLKPPFGILPLAALQATPEAVLAATYDPRQFRAHIWRSLDDGETWERAIEAETSWPVIATWGEPALFTLTATIFIQRTNGQWQQMLVGDGKEVVRRIVGSQDTLLALTTNSVLRSTDKGASWEHYATDLPVAQVLDIELADNTTYVLLTGGRVWSHAL